MHVIRLESAEGGVVRWGVRYRGSGG